MLALPGPKLVNQSAKVVSKPKLVPKDNVESGKIYGMRKKLYIGMIILIFMYMFFPSLFFKSKMEVFTFFRQKWHTS